MSLRPRPARARRAGPPPGAAAVPRSNPLSHGAPRRLKTLSLGPHGLLKLDGIREVALRAGRLAEALFGAMEADVVAVHDGRVWRGKSPTASADDTVARFIFSQATQSMWIADASLDERWKYHPGVRGAPGIRLFAAAPIRLDDGTQVGVLRVFDDKPRPFDPALAARLEDLAATVAEECDKLLGGDIKRMREFFEQAPGFVAILLGPDHVFELVNAAFVTLMGERAVIGLTLREALREVGFQGLIDLLDDVYSSGKPHVARGAQMLLRRGQEEALDERYLDFVCQPIRNASGEVFGVFFQAQDVTDAFLSAKTLEASQRNLEAALAALEAIFDNSLDVICTTDADGRFTRISPQCENVWGYRPDELVGRPLLKFVHPDDREATVAVAERIRTGHATKTFANRYVHKDGTAVPLTWSSVWSEDHQTMFSIGRDMREHEAVSEKLLQAQKMEAMGRLTGGVAHDFNNLLTVLIGSAELLSDGLADQPELQPIAQLIFETSQKGAELVKQLLAFSRKQRLRPQVIDCDAHLASMLPILQRAIGEQIEVDIGPPSGLQCRADPNQLTSALLNLCLNARDAMPGGGRLSLGVHREDRTAAVVGAGEPEPSMIAFFVEDDGEGMSPETVSRVLEPFFTTKGDGVGTGLGLSMVDGFAAQSGGRLEIRSQLGEGSRISIYLPESSQTPEAHSPPPQGEAPAEAAHRVLLVEDDAVLRGQVSKQLASLGYAVTVAADAQAALQVLSDSAKIDLLMTDVVMPGPMNGRQLADHARLLRPGLPVLFVSGYADDAVLREGRLDAISEFLPKPYRRDELAKRLTKVLVNG